MSSDDEVRQCQRPGVNPDDWFSTRASRVQRAKSLCDRCPAREACLRLALAEGDPDGIWGGLTGAERSSLTETGDEIAEAPSGTRSEHQVNLAA